MKVINDTQLIPKDGHVEVEIDGVRQYQKVETPQEKQIADLQAENRTLSAKISATTQSSAFLEECLVEMAGIVYA